jgi:hypothetical protein
MKWFGIALIVLALGIGIVPQFTDCYAHGQLVTLANGSTQPMKCHWTAQGEIALAVPILGIGAMMTSGRRKESARYLSILGIILGALVITLPTNLIGTCGMATHFCNTAMKPSLLALGSLAMVGSLGGLMLSFKHKD